eukprot:4813393-Prymnesium_polylepis.1
MCLGRSDRELASRGGESPGVLDKLSSTGAPGPIVKIGHPHCRPVRTRAIRQQKRWARGAVIENRHRVE